MAVKPFTKEELNFFKFASIVYDEFPRMLRSTFVTLWNTKIAPLPGYHKWDDTPAVRNLLLAREGGKTEIPTNTSFEDWDCTALFKATIYSKSFGISTTSGKTLRLSDQFIKGKKPSPFHSSLTSATGNQDEIIALAIDQVRLLRNRFCHLPEQRIEKVDFDNYVRLAKDAFNAVGSTTCRIHEIGSLEEEDFPTEKVNELKKVRADELENHRFLKENVNESLKTFGDDIKSVLQKVDNIEKHTQGQYSNTESSAIDLEKGLATIGALSPVVSSDGYSLSLNITAEKIQLIEDSGISGATFRDFSSALKMIYPSVFQNAVKKGFGGERDDQEVKKIRLNSLHVLLHVFTYERFLEVLDEFKYGRLKKCLLKEFLLIRINIKRMEIEVLNMEKIDKTEGKIAIMDKGYLDDYIEVREFAKKAHVKSMEEYQEMYNRSVEDPEGFWGEIAQQFHWHKPPTTFLSFNFNVENGPIFIKWMEGAQTNICYNVLDRIVKEKNGENTVAFYWEGNYPGDCREITYGQLLVEVCKFANVLKAKGVKKGDRVAIYLPMIIELVVAMLSCARIGAVHSIVFAGFSSEALAERLMHSKCSLLITADGFYRGTSLLDLKSTADKALVISKRKGHPVPLNIVVRHLGSSDENKSNVAPIRPSNIQINWNDRVDVWWHDEMKTAKTTCEPEWMDAEDPLFILYTSGSTGKPKGVVHTTAGYMLYTATTFKYVFDYHPGDVYWCTADIGLITGHSYITYGPMANGATSVIFEGAPTYPDPSRMWEICERHDVAIFCTSPHAIRSLMKFGEEAVNKHNRKSLKLLGSVGEHIDPKSWRWYHDVVGNKQCPVVGTYWQTETGGHMITPLPGATQMKPGSATFPFFGVVPAIVDKDGNELEGPCVGELVLKQPWPGMLRTLYDDHDRFESVYFKKFPGYYYTGDECIRDKDGYYSILGRVDDCMNVSGRLLSSAEIESALVGHDAVSEAAVVGYQHNVKGNGIFCYVTLMKGFKFSDELIEELKEKVRTKIGIFATPDVIQFAPALPKTCTGKIMRRALRVLARGVQSFGDLSTLVNPETIDYLRDHRPRDIPGIQGGETGSDIEDDL